MWNERILLKIDAPALPRIADQRSRSNRLTRRTLRAVRIRLRAVKFQRDRNIDRCHISGIKIHEPVTKFPVGRLYSRIETMDSPAAEEKLEIFNRQRQRLFGLAYRMLGTRAEAEEIVQDAYLRWHTSDLEAIENPEAWLISTTTRLSIDRLRKASRQRETYVGPWLPEPLTISFTPSPQEDAEFASSLSTAFMLMLERLSPTERAVFLLHDIFDSSYSDIARIMDREEPAVRQMLHRARHRVQTDKPRFTPNRTDHRSLVERFSRAAYTADEHALLDLFAPDIAVISDGGGKVTAARKIVRGLQKVVRIFTIAIPPAADRLTWKIVEINGEPGIIEFIDGAPFAANTFDVEDGKIVRLYRIMNPDKLDQLKDLV